MRLRVPAWVRWSLASATAAMTVPWLVWRVLWSGDGVSPLMFWPLLGAEVYAVVRLLLLVLRTGEPASGRSATASDIDEPDPHGDQPNQHGDQPREHGDQPREHRAPASLDVCIYVTAPHLRDAELAAMSALRVRGVGRVIVALPSVGADLTHLQSTLVRLGVDVVHSDGTRTGSIGSLIEASDADAIAFMSDRMVASATLWNRTRPLLAAEGVGWVSSRVSIPEYRRAEQVMHDSVVGPSLDHHGAVSWEAPGSVIVRRALTARADLAGLLVRRDEAVTVALHGDGWRGRWLSVPLVVPHRHASAEWEARATRRGMTDRLRLLWTSENPVVARGLTTWDRIATLGRQVDDLAGTTFVIVAAVVVGGLITNRLPMVWDRDVWLRLGLPAVLLGSVTRWVTSRGLLLPGALLRSDAQRSAASLRGLGRSLLPPEPRELITIEAVDPSGVSILDAARGQIALAVVLQGAVILRAALTKVHLPPPLHVDSIYLTAAVVMLVALYLNLGLMVRSRHRVTYRSTRFRRAGAMGDLVVEVMAVSPEVITAHARRAPVASEHHLVIRDRRLDFPLPVSVISLHHRRGMVVMELRPMTTSATRRDALLRVWAEGFLAENDARVASVTAGRASEAFGDGSIRPAPLTARVAAATALALTGVILVPPYGDALAAEDSCEPLGPTVGSFTEFVRGTSHRLGDSDGRVFVGGNLLVREFSVGASADGPESFPPFRLIVGGDLVGSGSTRVVGGGLSHGGSIRGSDAADVSADGIIAQQPSPIDPATVFALLRERSTDLAALPATPGTTVDIDDAESSYPILRLGGVDEHRNVFRLTAEDLERAREVYLRVPDGSSTLIDISWPTDDSVDLDRDGKGLNSIFIFDGARDRYVLDRQFFDGATPPSTAFLATRQRLLWNLAPRGSSEATIGTGVVSIPGTILAPSAALHFGRPDDPRAAANVNGSVVVDSIVSGDAGATTHSSPPLGCYQAVDPALGALDRASAQATGSTATTVAAPTTPASASTTSSITAATTTTVPTTGTTTGSPSSGSTTSTPQAGTTALDGSSTTNTVGAGAADVDSDVLDPFDQPQQLAFSGARATDLTLGAMSLLLAGIVLLPVWRTWRDRRGARRVDLSRDRRAS